MINVLIVDDSPVFQALLKYILSFDSDINVVGTANNGEEALAAVQRRKPDLVTMDINMPKMDGFEATRRIMETVPTPIVIVSASWDQEEVEKTFRAMEAGALAVLDKPTGIGHPNFEKQAEELIQKIKLMSEIRVVRRWARYRKGAENLIGGKVSIIRFPLSQRVKLAVIGASTGGPPVIQTILSALPHDFPLPIMIVQHIAPGFVQGFVDWLNGSSHFNVKLGVHGENLLPGCVYVAPDGFHMGVERYNTIVLNKDEPENGIRPAVSYLFRSAADVYGNQALGVLLSGMGRDGARELKMMREKGALTIAQDKESSVVFGMPGEAVKLQAAAYVLSPLKIATLLTDAVRENGKDLSCERQ